MKQLSIIGGIIHTEKRPIKNGQILIKNQKIAAIKTSKTHLLNAEVLEIPKNWHVIPGLIDVHIHGANGADTMDATPEALATMQKSLLREGVTSFLPTVISSKIEKIEQALNNIQHCQQNPIENGAEVLGAYLEGPFLSQAKACAQNVEFLLTPNLKLFKKWQKKSPNLIKIITLAPELPKSLEIIRYAIANNIVTAIGHTAADFPTTQRAISAGCSHATHLFNCMPSIHHRNPGPVVAILNNPNIKVEIIADGIHLHPAIIELAYKIKGPQGLIMVSDAMRAKYLKSGKYELGGQTVIVKNNEARLKKGILAGSLLRLDTALRNVIKFTGCTLDEAIVMTSSNAAKQLRVFDRKGSIAKNKDADLAILDENLQLKYTCCRGKLFSF